MSAPRPLPRLLHVQRVRSLGPRMRRITLGGPGLRGFPAGCEGAHIKLLFPEQAGGVPTLPEIGPQGRVWPAHGPRPHVRTYTVARIDPTVPELDVDIVLHVHGGRASDWARHARVGDAIGLIGPGGPPLFRPGADFQLLVGDPSSYALVHAVLDKLPPQARGQVLMQIDAPADMLPLPACDGMPVRWCTSAEEMVSTLRGLPRPDGDISVTLAGESHTVIALRNLVVGEWRVPRAGMYAVPYWKRDLDEEAYHEERHRIMDAFEASDAWTA